MSCKTKFREFENEFNKFWNLYIQGHRDLDVFRGEAITPNNVDLVNKIVSDLQDNYAELADAFLFIKLRWPLVEAALKEHDMFMQHLKENGEPETVSDRAGEPLQEGQA